MGVLRVICIQYSRSGKGVGKIILLLRLTVYLLAHGGGEAVFGCIAHYIPVPGSYSMSEFIR